MLGIPPGMLITKSYKGEKDKSLAYVRYSVLAKDGYPVVTDSITLLMQAYATLETTPYKTLVDALKKK